MLREAFLTAELGISGANFLVAETGTLALMENEGNIRLSTSLPRVHVAFVGIEKLLPRFADLALFLPLAARAATGQRLSTFVSLIQGPAREGEEGPWRSTWSWWTTGAPPSSMTPRPGRP